MPNGIDVKYKNKKNYFSVAVYIVCVSYYTITNYIDTKNRIYQEIDKNLIQAAKSMPLLINDKFYKKAMGKNTISKDEDMKHITLLSKFADTLELKYIYSLILQDGKIYFSTSSGTAEEIKTKHNLATYFTRYDDIPPEVNKAFETGGIQFAEYSDKWGTFRSVFIPMLTQNNFLYLSAADIEISYVESLLSDNLYKSIKDTILFILLIVPFIFFYIRQTKLSKEHLELKVKERTKELNDKTQQLQELASTDSMTKLYNRRHFLELSYSLILLAKRDKTNISVIMIDIDNFKNINDTYGHNIGDDIIIALASLLKQLGRKSDLISRWGGEEFVIILPNTDIKGTFVIAEKIRVNVEALMIISYDKELKFTISLGIAEAIIENDIDINDSINRADKALYVAKESGKNRIAQG